MGAVRNYITNTIIEKNSRKRGYGYGIFRGIEEIASGFPRSELKTILNILGMVKEKLCRISRSLRFIIPERCNTIIWRF